MQKPFDVWNKSKKNIHSKENNIYCHRREIWWSVLGLNIGTETDGKNKNFERPILILKVYYKSALVIPLTSKVKYDRFHFKVKVENQFMYAKLTQVRTIDTKRLLRKIGTLDTNNFEKLIIFWKASI